MVRDTPAQSQSLAARRWSDILDVLHTIALAGTAAEDEDALLERVTQIVGELWQLDNFGVMLLDRESGALRLHPSYQRGTTMTHLESVALGEGITGQVARTGRPICTGNVRRHPHYIAVNPQVRSELCVPLLIDGEIIGVVDVESCQPDSFSEQDQQVLTTLAAQIATAIDRLRRTSEAKQQTQQIQTIYELGQQITSILQLDTLLPAIANLITTTLNVHSTHIALVEGERMVCRASSNGDPTSCERPMSFSIHEQPLRDIIHTGKKRMITAPREMLVPNHAHAREISTEILLPLQLNGTTIGLLIVASGKPPHAMASDVALLEFLADQITVAIQNAQLFTAMRQKTQELTSLYETALMTNQVSDPRQLVKQLYKQIEPLLAPDDFHLVLYDEPKDELEVAFSMRKGKRIPDVSPLHRPLEASGLTGWVIRRRETLLINDMETEALPTAPCDGACARSWLGMPLIAYQQVIGALTIGSKQKDAFETNQQRFMESIASQVATALISTQMHQEVAATADQLAILHASSQELISIRADAEEVYRAIHKTVSRLMEAEAFVIALLDQQKDQIYFPYLVDRGERRAARRVARDACLSGEIIATGESRLIPDIKKVPARIKSKLFHFGDPISIRSILAVPLRLHGQVFGMLATESYQPNAFTLEHQRILEMLAFDAAIALENARLFIEEHKRRQELEAIRKATLQLTSSLELKPVLQAILKHALELVGGDDAHIFLYDGQELQFGAARWADGERRKPFSEPRRDGLTYTVVRSGERVAVENLSTHPLFKDTDWEGAILGLPLLIDQRVIGVMNIAFARPHTFSENEMRVLTLLADQAALAIHNANLFAESRARATDLAAALERLQQLDTMKSQFIQNTSHELRTPVTLIRGYAELLESGRLGELAESQATAINVITRRARVLSKMLDDFNAILETESRKTEWGPVEIARLLQKIIKEYRKRIDEKELTFETILEAESALVLGNEVHLHRVVDNLLDNAVKFTAPGGKITLRFQKEDGWALIEVTDTGIGIPNDQWERIFERFYQVDGSMTRRYGGTGLGLALVKEITESHGGGVDVESEVGEGSTFQVKLPLMEET